VLNDENLDILVFEMNMAQIQESASLFEVNVPEFKLLKQCRKELKLLKVRIVKLRKADCINDVITLIEIIPATLGLREFGSFVHK